MRPASVFKPIRALFCLVFNGFTCIFKKNCYNKSTHLLQKYFKLGGNT